MARRVLVQAVLGILLLAAVHQIGVRGARAQGGGLTVVDSDLLGGGSYVALSNGDVYFGLYPSTGEGARWRRVGNVGASDQIISIRSAGGSTVQALAADGNFYVSTNEGATWTRRSNVFTGPVATDVRGETWGALKARYR